MPDNKGLPDGLVRQTYTQLRAEFGVNEGDDAAKAQASETKANIKVSKAEPLSQPVEYEATNGEKGGAAAPKAEKPGKKPSSVIATILNNDAAYFAGVSEAQATALYNAYAKNGDIGRIYKARIRQDFSQSAQKELGINGDEKPSDIATDLLAVKAIPSGQTYGQNRIYPTDKGLRLIKFIHEALTQQRVKKPSKVRHSLAPKDLAFAQDVLNELAEVDELFRYAVSDKTTLAGVMKDTAPAFKFVGDETRADEKQESGADSRLLFNTDKGKPFYVYQRGDEVWIDVSRLDTGERGSAIYAAVGNYAFNTGKVFIGDPEGLSDDAVIRRTSNMLSLALRFGSTDFMEPSPEQKAGIPSQGVAPLKWQGGDIDKVKALIDTFLSTLNNQFPELKDVRYNFDKRQFVDRSNRFLDGAFFDNIRSEDAGADATRARAGEATARRGIFIQSLVSSTGSQRPGILEHVLSRANSLVTKGGLKGLFSKNKGNKPQPKGFSPTALTTALKRRFNPKLIDQLLARGEQGLKGGVVIVDTVDGVPIGAMPSGVQGFYNQDTGITYLVAQNLNDITAPAVLAHEIIHATDTAALQQQAETLLASRALQSTPKALAEFLNSVNQRMIDADVEGDVTEIASYIVEQAAILGRQQGFSAVDTKFLNFIETTLGKRVAELIRKFVASVRAALLKRGVGLALTVDDLSAFANAGMKQAARGAVNGNDNGTLRSEQAQRFYSALTRMVQNAPDKVFAGGKQVVAWLKANRAQYEVKIDELYWSGVEDWLNLQGKVSKADVLGFLKEGGVKVEEVELGEFGYDFEKEGSLQHSLDVLNENSLTPKMDGERLSFEKQGVSSPNTYDDPWSFDPEADLEQVRWYSLDEIKRDFGVAAENAAKDIKNYVISQKPKTSKYQQYTVPGGKEGTYRELLLTLPVIENNRAKQNRLDELETEFQKVLFSDLSDQEKDRQLNNIRSQKRLVEKAQPKPGYQSSHFDQPNIVAHLRFDERTDADGNNVLFIQEIQSDWGQEGKKKRFVKPFTPDMPLKANLEGMGHGVTWEVTTEDGRFITNVSPGDFLGDRAINTGQYRAITEQEAITVARRRLRDNPQRTANKYNIPPAPFVTDTKAWVALGIKHAISQAVDVGIDKITFITGEQAADLYDLSKQVNERNFSS